MRFTDFAGRFRPFATAGALTASLAIAPHAAFAEDVLKVGLSVQLDLQQGRDGRDGLQLAIKEINKEGGILGRKVVADIVDETSAPEAAVNSVRKLLDDDKVDVLFCGTSSGNVFAELPSIADAQKVTFIVGAASPEITAKVADDYSTYKYLFKMNLNSNDQSQAMLDFVKNVVIDQLGKKKIAILADNSKWAQEETAKLKGSIGSYGGTVTDVEVVAPDTQDFTAPLSRIVSSGAQFVVSVLVYAKSDVLAKAYHDTKFPLLYGGMDGPAMDDAFFKRVNGANVGQITAVYGGRAPLTAKTLSYFDAFKKEYGRDPGYEAWTLDSALHIYKHAVETAKSFDSDKVIPEIEKLTYVSPGGTLQWDKRHEVRYGPDLMSMFFNQWMPDGSRNFVYPSKLRTKDIIKPDWQK